MLDIINSYIHGYVAIPVIVSLVKKNLFKILKEEGPITLEEISDRLDANTGHLQVALNMLEALGWVENKRGFYKLIQDNDFFSNLKTIPSDIIELYRPISHLFTKKESRVILNKYIEYLLENKNIPIKDLLEGAIIVPLLIICRLYLYENNQLAINKIPKELKENLLLFYKKQNWFDNNNYVINDTGKFMHERALNMALAASYAPMLNQIDELIFGNPKNVFKRNIFGHETHIDRELNIISSAFQHERYFSDIEGIILSIFNKESFKEQPDYIIDMGCGDGSLLRKIYNIILNKTRRGDFIKEYPLIVIGVDYNKKALRLAEKNLRTIPHYTIPGDISEPQKLIRDLEKLGLKNIEKSLHVRSFLDHDRPYLPPNNKFAVYQRQVINYSGAYVNDIGEKIPAAELIQSLIEHLEKWKQIINLHGIIILEVHALDPKIIRNNFNQSESFYFDALQAFSKQYPVAADTFLVSACEAGLFPRVKFSKNYPQTQPFTRISLHYFEKRTYKLAYAQIQDLDELIKLEEDCWIEQLRISEIEIKNRILQFPEGQFVVKNKSEIIGVIFTQKIHSIDLLKTTTANTISNIHSTEGVILQLIGINLKPEYQGKGIGDELLEFVLLWSKLKGIKKVVGVSRCKNYINHQDISVEEYIKRHNESPNGIDPILRFHTSHGANIVDIIPNYRPQDRDNRGAGILVEYNLDLPQYTIKKESVNESTSIYETVHNCILQLMPEKFANQYSDNIPLRELGYDSLRLLELRMLLNQNLKLQLEPTFFFQYGTCQEIINYLNKNKIILHSKKGNKKNDRNSMDTIAIIGVGCRFPASVKNTKNFWNLLKNKIDGVTNVPQKRNWDIEESRIKKGGFLTHVDEFDNEFFHISPREAELMDPQQRILLEVAWESLENAGIASDSLKGSKTGVFIGVFSHDYELVVEKIKKPEELDAYFGTGVSESVLAGRISYELGLQGPALVVNTACSSSLVSVHLACQSLLQNECDLALAGGVNLILLPDLSFSFEKAGMLSSDGHCKTFDESADGYVRGEGCGIIVLKKLKHAIKDRDNILAIIRSTVINQDGASNGLTAPNELSQEILLKSALEKANLRPEQISYIETHGTGTSLGDPVEVKALVSVYCKEPKEGNPLILGSVKTNIGHTEGAAGIASIIKAILVLQHRAVPANLHFNKLNHFIDNEDKLIFPTELIPLKNKNEDVLRVGVSSFGFSGTNAHAILEEYVPLKQNLKNKSHYVITLSAKTKDTIKRKMLDIQSWLKNNNNKYSLQEISYTLNLGRNHFDVRCAIVVNSIDQLISILDDVINNKKIENAFISDQDQFNKKIGDKERYQELIDSMSRVDNIITEKEYYNNLIMLSKYYVEGFRIDWTILHSNEQNIKIPLPSYPFSNNRFWVTKNENDISSLLLDNDNVTADTRIFKKLFKGNEFYLEEHQIGNHAVLPAVAYIAMVYEASRIIKPDAISITMKNINFLNPLRFNSKAIETIVEFNTREDENQFEISNSEKNIIYANGKISYVNIPKNDTKLKIEEIKKRCLTQYNKKDIYTMFSNYGAKLGLSFQSIITLFSNGDNECLSSIKLPEHLELSRDRFKIHPSLLDGLIQTALTLLKDDFEKYDSVFVPFGIGQIIIYGPLSKVHYAYAERLERRDKLGKLRVAALDESGNVLLQINDFISRPIKLPVEHKEESDINFYKPDWQHMNIKNKNLSKQAQSLLLFENNINESKIIQNEIIIFRVENGNDFQKKDLYRYQISRNQQDYKLLFDDIQKNNILPQIIVFDSSFNENQENNFQDIVFLCQALANFKNKNKFHLFFINHNANINRLYTYAFYGFAKTLQLEIPQISFHIIDSEEININLIADEVNSSDILVRYQDNKRWIRYYKPITLQKNKKSILESGGVYLITGGASGLGLLIAKYLVKEYGAHLILTGRKPYNEQIKLVISELNSFEIKASYIQADVSNLNDMENVIKTINSTYGRLNGILHCSGVTNDSFLIKKTVQEINNVFKPKISGAQILDDVTKFLNLDFFILFSSITSIFGNVGQGDYSYANSFLNEFAIYRNKLCDAKQRHGVTISICWQFWSSGGMQINDASKQWMEQIFGLKPLATHQGLDIFTRIFSLENSVIIPLFGDREIYEKKLGIGFTGQNVMPTVTKPNDTLQSYVLNHLIQILSFLIKQDSHRINPNKALSNYGVDSIIITSLTNEINKYYQIELTPAMLFEHTTLSSLCDYLIENNTSAIEKKWLTNNEQIPVSTNQGYKKEEHIENDLSTSNDIAVIGMSGIFPGSPELDTFWNNLVNQKALISEIPKSRWNWEDFYGEGDNKIKVKWGCFVDEIDKFDAKFFKISPNEAEVMDPQHRIFLQIVWKTIEDAGYAVEDLATHKIGVFVGAATSDYAEILSRLKDITPHVSTGMMHSILANRISYIFNFNGPSESIDTACSSSLVAIHNAMKAIQNGDCEVAIAGGVNALLTPTLFISFTKAGMLSPDGQCKTFDKSANGYVRGEGAGAILLKSLSKAIADNDSIYGIIKGSAVNHGGHVNSLTVPNPKAQAELIATAIRRANISPDTITYIETHGTGTALGDPVEVNGLIKGFKAATLENGESKKLPIGYAGLSSLKTNIGHLEAAAGIAGVIKILLAMRYKTLPGIVNFNQLNPYIQLENSPFYIIEDTQPWKRLRDKFGNEVPLRAGISSFGFGGAYGHLIIEEPPVTNFQVPKKSNYLITLSAKTSHALYEKIKELNIWLKKKVDSISLEDISYTLNVGRTHFEERCAIVVNSLNELIDTLQSILNKESKTNYYIGTSSEDNENVELKIMNEILNYNSLDEKKYRDYLLKLGNFFIQGHEIDWKILHEGESKHRISLPSYPFEMKRYWVPESDNRFMEVNYEKRVQPSIPIRNNDILKVEDRSLNKIIENELINLISSLLNIKKDELDVNKELGNYGMDSIYFTKLTNLLNQTYNLELTPANLFESANISKLSQYLINNYSDTFDEKIKENINIYQEDKIISKEEKVFVEEDEIAIIGMSGIFPGASNIEMFWENLINKRDVISKIPDNRWNYKELNNPENISKWGAFVEDIDKFDAEFFNTSPYEAELMDPQQRIFLEVVWNCIEHAGYNIEYLSSEKTGLFVGVASWDYSELLHKNQLNSSHVATGTVHSIIANRVSYLLDLHGPSMVIDTACSSSLIAIHEAVKSIRNRDCDIAIVGGVNAIITPSLQVEFSLAGMLSTDGKCKTFDKDANGYVRGEGAGAILLKPLSKALKEHDTIYGIIKGSAINHGGRVSSLTVPNPQAQADLVISSIEHANLGLDEISYIETHGTGTSLGDPIEVNGLIKAFQELSQKQNKPLKSNYCGLGSVKTNIGHLEAAAGIASVIKVLLSMQYNKLPALLNFNNLNPFIKIDNTPFFIVKDTIDWPSSNMRTAGISCFGFGGANAHMIISDYPPKQEKIENTQAKYLITLSAKNESSLKQKAVDLEEWIKKYENNFQLEHLSYTLTVGRKHFKKRCAFIISDFNELNKILNLIKNDNMPSNIFSNMNQGNITLSNERIEVEQFKNNLENIAKLYVEGNNINFDILFNNKKRIALPTYPFNKKRYWIAKNDVHNASYWIANKTWQMSSALPSNYLNVKIAVITTSMLEKIKNLLSSFDSNNIIYITDDLKNIPSNVTAFIDFSDLDSNTSEWQRIELLQNLLKKKPAELYYIHFTRKIQDLNCEPTSLSGVMMASLIPSLSAEFPHLYGKTVDIDVDLDEIQILKRIVITELFNQNKQSEICYRDQKRYIPNYVNIYTNNDFNDNNKLNELSIDSNKVYIITGGTGDIGKILADYLVELGARYLILTGSRLQSIDKVNELIKQHANTKIEFYYEDLANEEQLTNFIDNIKIKYGEIGGVIHCAGRLPEKIESFVNKRMDHIKALTRPKIAALQILHNVFKKYPLDFFILFSSISSQIPILGAGICDYAMANGYMNYFAKYQYNNGYTYYRAIAWGRWNTKKTEDRKIYKKLGLLSINKNQGLNLLNKALESKLPIITTSMVNDKIFNKENLLSLNHDITTSNIPNAWLTEVISKILKIPKNNIDPDANFSELGVDSILIAELTKDIELRIKKHFDPNAILEFPTLNLLSQYFRDNNLIESETPKILTNIFTQKASMPIAIIGIACHFPLAENKEIFWDNLKNGISAITEVPSTRWNVNELYCPYYQSGKSISKWGGFLSNIEYFDPNYFSIKEDDAAQIDPLERQFLEVSAEVLADAGYSSEELSNNKIGVYVGCRISNYADRLQFYNKNTIIGIGQNFIATHTSHFFNFKGPSLVIDTACSSSLVSLHMACQSIHNGESHMAIAGGVDILLDERPYLILSEGKALSPDGKCHTFDEEANGFVPGEGAGAVLLKPLAKAIQDGDKIYAIIEGSAINNDGKTMGITTPNSEAQKDVILAAYKQSEIDPSTVSYVETHGTGTLIGDPIELKSLTAAFDNKINKKNYCAVGSVKTNIGHAMSAAGIASVIKVALSLYYKQIVPTLNCLHPNPRFNFDESPFYPNTSLKNWDPINGIRRAGVSSFGFGGTNVHCIMRNFEQDAVSIKRHSLPKIIFNKRKFWLEKHLTKVTNKKQKVDTIEKDIAYEHFEEFFIKRIVK